MATYGDFPGVKVETQSGGVSSVAIGAEEKLVIFGEASYNASNEVEGDDATLNVSANEPEQIGAPRVADQKFGSGSELADAMKEALENDANIDYLYGVAVDRVAVSGESFSGSSSSTGTLDNVEIVEDTSTISNDGSLEFEFRYTSPPPTPTASDRAHLNPLTGEFAVTSGTVSSAASTIDYEYNDYAAAFGTKAVQNVVNEEETGVWWALSDSDSVSSSMESEVSNLRTDYQLVNGFCFAEPNDSEVLSTDPGGSDFESTRGGADARYDTANYSGANQSVTAEYFYKLAPARKLDQTATIGGGVAGLFAGNSLDDPIYNDEVVGYDEIEQQFSRTEADEMRNEDIIPIRSGGALRVKGNRSTAFSSSDTVAATFWTRRVTDRVILIAKRIGEETLGRINDDDARSRAERRINAEMRQLANQRLIQPNTPSEQNWNVSVYEDANNSDEANIDIGFNTYGIVKNVDETITVNTN